LPLTDESCYPCSSLPVRCMFAVLMSLIFSPAACPVLLSFPTRRSSDLVGAHHVSGTRLADLPTRHPTRLDQDYSTAWPGSGIVLDRKSTRLNSSHVSISYAVFCLKKKKPYHQKEIRGITSDSRRRPCSP